MRKKQLRIITGVALAASLIAAALTLALRPPTGPGEPDTSIYECTLFLLVAQLLVLALYYACILYCGRRGDEG